MSNERVLYLSQHVHVIVYHILLMLHLLNVYSTCSIFSFVRGR